jgi:hypothetical protein
METMCYVSDSYWWNTSGVYRIYGNLTYLPFILFCKGIAQTSCHLDPQLYFSNESHNSNFLNEEWRREQMMPTDIRTL